MFIVAMVTTVQLTQLLVQPPLSGGSLAGPSIAAGAWEAHENDYSTLAVCQAAPGVLTGHPPDPRVVAGGVDDMRIICRRERPSSGAQLCALEETDGWCYQPVATNTPRKQLAFLEARHRVHARGESSAAARPPGSTISRPQ